MIWPGWARRVSTRDGGNDLLASYAAGKRQKCHIDATNRDFSCLFAPVAPLYRTVPIAGGRFCLYAPADHVSSYLQGTLDASPTHVTSV